MKLSALTAATILAYSSMASACMKVTVKYDTSISTIYQADLWDNNIPICRLPSSLPIVTRTSQSLSCITIDGLPWSAVLHDPNTTKPWVEVSRGDFKERIYLFYETRSGMGRGKKLFTAAVWECSREDRRHSDRWVNAD